MLVLKDLLVGYHPIRILELVFVIYVNYMNIVIINYIYSDTSILCV